MGTLDSRVALALMAKAQRVFAQPGQVLAFPVGASSYSSRQLNFFPAAPTAEDLRVAVTSLQAFSSFVNMVPNGQLWLELAGRQSLPQIYRHVLTQAQIAGLHEDAEDLEHLRLARALLTERRDDGAEFDTAMYAAYKRYRDAYLLTDQQYNAAKISGELSSSSDAHQAWIAGEPPLLAVRTQALIDWQIEGHRVEIENALAQIASLTRKAPVTSWNEWKLKSEEGYGTVKDIVGDTFWPTYISPANAFEVGWQRMVLTSGEVITLQESVPTQLKARLGTGQPELELENLEFEYTTAKLHRPWFDGAVFTARFWRPAAAGELLISTGQEPYEGACPLYATAVVFFRRIRATVQGDLQEVNTKLDTLGQRIDLGLFAVERPKLKITRPERIPLGGPGRVDQLLPRDPHIILRQDGWRDPARAFDVERVPLAAANFSATDVFDKRTLLRGFMYQPALPQIHWTPPPSPASSVLETAEDEIFVLALICTIVPACPNPDNTLDWN